MDGTRHAAHATVSVRPNMDGGAANHGEFLRAGLLLNDLSTYDTFDAGDGYGCETGEYTVTELRRHGAERRLDGECPGAKVTIVEGEA